MDLQRSTNPRAKLRRRLIMIGAALIVAAAITIILSQLEPAVPVADRSLVWIDSVKRGRMLRQVRGPGVLVPEDIAWIAARTQGRVEQIVLRPGAPVKPDSIILVLSNPDVHRAAEDAASQLVAAEAEYVNLKVQLESNVLAAESVAAGARADYEQARMRAEVNEQLFADGLVSELDLRLLKVTAEQAATRHSIEQKRHAFTREAVTPQLAVKQAEVERVRAQARLRKDELEALHVRAGKAGILQVLPVEVGAQVQPGANLARVADPARLKAEIRVPETQARDIQTGQIATVDTRNGVVEGCVARIDPSVQNGTVTVDIALAGELPRGARPDLSVDGVIELERLDDVIYTGRPAVGQEGSLVGIFKLNTAGTEAARVPVKLGRSSVNTIEILEGLHEGDRVILSDMAQWAGKDRIKLR